MVAGHVSSIGLRGPQADAARLARALAAVEAVADPEIPVVTIAELGILRGLHIDDADAARVLVAVITPTYSGCPAMDQIADDVSRALDAAEVGVFRVQTVLSPAWTTDWITAEGRRKLRAFGIAPPAHGVAADGARPIRLVQPARAGHVACPQCGSHDTVCISAFGSTACKALYRCRACREPFDYFKPY